MHINTPGAKGPDIGYPDPPRSWTRAGLLLAGWLAAWSGALVFGLGLKAVADSQAGEPDLPLDGQAVAREFFRETFGDRDPARASDLLCDGYTGLSSQELLDWLVSWEADNGKVELAEIAVRPAEPPTDPESFRVNFTYGSRSNPSIQRYMVTTTPGTEDACVAEVRERAPEPEPDDTPTEPQVSARQTVQTFLADIFKNQDSEAAQQIQCRSYSGIEPAELLTIRADHVHEGAGDVLYQLELVPREPVDGNDRFQATVTLDDEVHEFMVLFDPAPEQRCIASVTAD